jgi:hypothetical protein
MPSTISRWQFGFRALGEAVDGGVDDGPYWEMLTAFAEEPSFYTANDAGTLVCGPMAAEVADDSAFDQARRKIDAISEPVGRVGRSISTPASRRTVRETLTSYSSHQANMPVTPSIQCTNSLRLLTAMTSINRPARIFAPL